MRIPIVSHLLPISVAAVAFRKKLCSVKKGKTNSLHSEEIQPYKITSLGEIIWFFYILKPECEHANLWAH